MIQQLPISLASRNLIHEFTLYLKAKGYQGLNYYQIGVIEFIYRLEESGTLLKEVDQEILMGHYEYLLKRPNCRGHGALAPSTVHGYLFSLKLFFNYLNEIGFLEEDPMSVLSFKLGSRKERMILSLSEINLLYEVCVNVQERAILSLFYGCGLRKSEVEALDIRDVDLKGLWLYVRSGKGKKRRVVPLTKRIKSDLSNYYYKVRPGQISLETIGKHGLSFMLNSRGRRMLGSIYWKNFKKILERSGINKPVSLHHLRHCVATHLLASGLRVEEVRDFLGHEFIETTQIYTRVDLSKYAL